MTAGGAAAAGGLALGADGRLAVIAPVGSPVESGIKYRYSQVKIECGATETEAMARHFRRFWERHEAECDRAVVVVERGSKQMVLNFTALEA